MSQQITIIEAIRDPNILGDTLAPAQEAALRAMYGLPLEGEQRELAEQCAGLSWAEGEEYREAAFICGRRSGKSDKLASNVAIYEAFFRDHNLSAGETGIVLLLAQNMRQAKVVKGYIEGKINRSPVLRRHIVASRAQELELDNGITIAIHPSSFRSVRGLSVVCCICDEIAFWWTEDSYANPDVEVIRAVRPALATFPHGKLLMVSSPYTMTGVLWDAWQGREKDNQTLVWHAPTRLMNPTVPDKFLKREQERDPENYRREYEAEFTEAVSSFLPIEMIEQCVVEGRAELPPDKDEHHYVAAVDAAFKGDTFTLCIAHSDKERGKIVIDLLAGWLGSKEHPLRLSEVVPQIKEMCSRYNVHYLKGDQFGAEPLRDAFEREQITFEEYTFTNQSKADLYATLRTRIMDGAIELLDHPTSVRELRGLEVENLPGGSMRVRHARHARAHDDYADAIALAVFEAKDHLEAFCMGMSAGTRETYKLRADYSRLSSSHDDYWR